MSTRSLAFAPSGLFEMLMRSFWLAAVNLPALVALAVVVVVPLGLIAAAIAYVSPTIGAVVGVLAYLVGVMYYYAAATLLLAISMSGGRVGILQLFKHLSGKATLDVLGTGLLVAVIVFVGTLLLVVPGIYFGIRYMFATPVALLEGIRGGKALERSQELTSGAWWRCFGALLLLYIFVYAIFLFISLVSAHVGAGVWLILPAELLLTPCMYVFPILLYFDARVRKDGFIDVLPLREGV